MVSQNAPKNTLFKNVSVKRHTTFTRSKSRRNNKRDDHCTKSGYIQAGTLDQNPEDWTNRKPDDQINK